MLRAAAESILYMWLNFTKITENKQINYKKKLSDTFQFKNAKMRFFYRKKCKNFKLKQIKKLKETSKKLLFGKALEKNKDLVTELTARRSCRWCRLWADPSENAGDSDRSHSAAATSCARHPPIPLRYSKRMSIWGRCRHAPWLMADAAAAAGDDNAAGSLDVASPANPLVNLCCWNGAGSSRDAVSFRVTFCVFVIAICFGFIEQKFA